MKLLPLNLIPILLLVAACTTKQPAPANSPENALFLTPEVMCGTVEFKDGCGAKTDTLIRFGLALLHHMTYDDAAYTFDKVIAEDPDCFWGHWGKAMTYIHPLWPDAPSEAQMESGYLLSQRALALAKKPNEKLYGEALASFYAKSDKTKIARLADFEKGWAEAHAQLPDDPEAELFYNLFKLSTASPADKTFTVQKEVGAATEKLLMKYPDHPGAFHYTIHAYDVPPLAEYAIAAARKYGKIAPEIPHALHMPSHIFTRKGLWQESIDWNTRASNAALRLSGNGPISHHTFHAFDYMAYALLQQGQDEKARLLAHRIDSFNLPFDNAPATAYAIAALEARIPLEIHDWKGAAAVPLPDTSVVTWNKYPQYEALRYFARGIGGARSDNMDVAKSAYTKLDNIYNSFNDAPENKYWKDQVNIQRIAVQAWIAYAENDKANALKLMQESADLEEATQKNPVSPGELLPARELLADMYMDLKQPEKALEEYKRSLASRPNRFNSLFGAGKAAEMINDRETAKDYYGQLIAIQGSTPSKRESSLYAQQFVRGI